MRKRIYRLALLSVIIVAALITAAGGTYLLFMPEKSRNLNAFILIIVVALAAAVIISVILAMVMSRKIVHPVSKMDFENMTLPEDYDELKPMLDHISEREELMREQLENEKEKNRQMGTTDRAQGERLRREFTANVSHELKTPLTSISGFAEIIKSGLAHPDDVEHFAEKIYDEAQHLITLVGDIIRLSQLDEVSMPNRKEPVDLFVVAEEAIEKLYKMADERLVTVMLEGGSEYVTGARIILYEIIFNLTQNSIKYNRPGGSVRVFIGEEDGCPIIRVSDNGIGISEIDRERVFERFYRSDKSHSKEIPGTGLGLSIVKHGAAYHDAVVNLESELGVGTTVTVRFEGV